MLTLHHFAYGGVAGFLEPNGMFFAIEQLEDCRKCAIGAGLHHHLFWQAVHATRLVQMAGKGAAQVIGLMRVAVAGEVGRGVREKHIVCEHSPGFQGEGIGLQVRIREVVTRLA